MIKFSLGELHIHFVMKENSTFPEYRRHSNFAGAQIPNKGFQSFGKSDSQFNSGETFRLVQ
jgi:hypothetical protein